MVVAEVVIEVFVEQPRVVVTSAVRELELVLEVTVVVLEESVGEEVIESVDTEKNQTAWLLQGVNYDQDKFLWNLYEEYFH